MSKIIIINRFFYPDHSATSQLLSDLAFHMAGKNSNVLVMTSRQVYDNPLANLLPREIVRGVHVIRVWSTRFGRANLIGRALDYLTFYVSAFIYLLRIVNKSDIIVAKTDPPLISVVASWAARIKKAKLVNWVQDLFPEVAIELGVDVLQGKIGSLIKRLRNKSLSLASRNVVLGEQMKQRLLNEGIDQSSITVIHNWSDENQVYPVSSTENKLRDEWNLANTFVVGYSGNMGRAHDFDSILDAAEILKLHTDIVFLFIGDGAKRAWLAEQVDSRNLTNVIFKPYQPRERLAESLSVPDVHLITLNPKLEGLIVPSKFYGIIAVGRPILFVGSQSGEVADMIKKADCGISVALEDASALACSIEVLKNDGTRCIQMASNARTAFDQDYSMQKALNDWQDVLILRNTI